MKIEWISVRDAIPSHTDKVLVYFGHVDNVLMGRSFIQGWKVFFSDGEKFVDTNNSELITHWMEIPKPPKSTP